MPSSPPRNPAYKDVSLPQLRTFCEVCRHGGFAPAARALRLTTPAVWVQVRALEQHFGLPLIERHSNRTIPTVHGERLKDLSQSLLAGAQSIGEVLRQREGIYPRHLVIATNLRVLVDEISTAMALFRREHAQTSLRIRYTGGEAIPSMLLEGDANVVLTLAPGPDEVLSPALEYEQVSELDYLLVTPPRHALTRKRPLTLQALTDFPLILGDAEAYSRHRVGEVFHQNNLLEKMNVAIETSSDEYTMYCVRAGLGVGIVVGKPTSSLLNGLAVRSLTKWFGTARVGFLWRRGAYVPPLEAALCEMLRNQLLTRKSRR